MNSGGLRTPVFRNYQVRCTHQEGVEAGIDQAEVTYRWVNNTSREVRIKSRLGVNSILKPDLKQRGDEYVDVFIVWRMTEEAFRATYIDLQDRHTVPDETTQKIINAFYLAKDSSPFQGLVYSLTVQMEFHMSDILAAGGSVYVEDLDVTICFAGEQQKFAEHPFSKNSRAKASLAQELPSMGNETFVMSIRAIDNGALRNRHDRFMMVGSEVYHIPIERDPDMLDGIHVTRRRTATVKNMGGLGHSIEHEHLTFEEADKKYCLFETIEQAKAGVSQAEMRKEEMSSQAYERTRERADREHEQWREKMQYEQQQSRDKEERQRYRANEEEVKENTRNFGDWIKLTTGIISSAFALVTTLLKLKPA
jgi:hypothetical protein